MKTLWVIAGSWKALGERVKEFFAEEPASVVAGVIDVPGVSDSRPVAQPPALSARVAVYDAPAAAPRTEEIVDTDEVALIEQVATRVFTHARDAGGTIPYTVIHEVTENFIHADFREPVVSVLEFGRTIRFADQGPGIADKCRAVLPGFTTARGSMKSVIRGVGSGLPIVNDYLGFCGGSLDIDDNLGYGTVITIRSASEEQLPAPPSRADDGTKRDLAEGFSSEGGSVFPSLTSRQMQVLSLVLELSEVGPTIVSNELSVALSTAYRDLAFLEHNGLIESNTLGKRVLTTEGASFLESLFAQ